MNPYLLAGLLAVAGGGFLLARRSRMFDQRPGEYFDWKEFQVTSTGLPNDLPLWARANVGDLVANVLDPLRRKLNKPIRITSGYRSPEVNAAVGGSKTSDHMTGRAVDLAVAGMSAREIADVIRGMNLPYDQLIVYSPDRGGHLHVSYREGNNRGQYFDAR